MRECRGEKAFDVTEMRTEEFLSAGNLLKNITQRDKEKTTGQKVSWLETHEIILHRDRPFEFHMNYDLQKDKVSPNKAIINIDLLSSVHSTESLTSGKH